MSGFVVVLAAESTSAGWATAIATIITATGGLILAVAVLIPNLRETRQTAKQVAVVHTIVNQQRTDSQRYNIALIEALRHAGVAVPIDQSLPVLNEPDADAAPPARPTT